MFCHIASIYGTPPCVTASQNHNYLKWGWKCEEKFLVIYITKSIFIGFLLYLRHLKQLWFCDSVTIHRGIWRFRTNTFMFNRKRQFVLNFGNKFHFTMKIYSISLAYQKMILYLCSVIRKTWRCTQCPYKNTKQPIVNL